MAFYADKFPPKILYSILRQVSSKYEVAEKMKLDPDHFNYVIANMGKFEFEFEKKASSIWCEEPMARFVQLQEYLIDHKCYCKRHAAMRLANKSKYQLITLYWVADCSKSCEKSDDCSGALEVAKSILKKFTFAQLINYDLGHENIHMDYAAKLKKIMEEIESPPPGYSAV